MCIISKLLASRELTALSSKLWPGKTLYVLGTAHVSKKSVESVQRVLTEVRPRAVMVELCEKRHILMDETVADTALTMDELTTLMKRMLRGDMSNLFGAVYSFFLSRTGKLLESKPGAEFVAALTLAKAQGAELVLGDRDVTITLGRCWSGLDFTGKTTLTFSMIYSGLVVVAMGKKDLEKEVSLNVATRNCNLSSIDTLRSPELSSR